MYQYRKNSKHTIISKVDLAKLSSCPTVKSGCVWSTESKNGVRTLVVIVNAILRLWQCMQHGLQPLSLQLSGLPEVCFPGTPYWLGTQLSASPVMNPVSETPEWPDPRCRLTVGFTSTVIPPPVAVKVINPTKRSEAKLFMLHNVDVKQFSCPGNAREVIAGQLGEEIVSPASYFWNRLFQWK